MDELETSNSSTYLDPSPKPGGFGEGAEPSIPPPKRFRPFIHYETFVWVVYGTFTILAVVDRFVWNVWPRQTYNIGAGSAGSDFVDGLQEGPWAVKFYDAFARISGRYTIFALNILLFTMSRTTYAWLAESWLARNIFDMRNYIKANLRLHKWNGILIVGMTLLHVWSIVFPSIFNGWHSRVVAGSFEWLLSERKPEGVSDIDNDIQTMTLQVDDVFRIVEMTVLLGILLPLSFHWMSTRWHFGVQLHSLISTVYFIDIVRRHTHPHSWILNTPFFFYRVIDVIIGMYWKREGPEVFKIHLSQDYLLLFWNQLGRSKTVGPEYFLKLKDSSLMERAHIFTGFENRTQLDLIDGKPWSACLVVRVYDNKRRPRLGKKDKYSHTKRVAESSNLDLWTWGPFIGDMSEKIRVNLESGARPVTLIAGGSGAGYIIDAIQLYTGLYKRTTLTCLYTIRDVEMFKWVSNVIAHLLRIVIKERVCVVVALTGGKQRNDQESVELVKRMQAEMEDLSSAGESDGELSRSKLYVQYGRLNFFKQIPDRNIVYFQGSGGLHDAVESGCKARKCRFIDGPAYDQDVNKKKNILHSLRLKCFDSREEIV